MSGPGGVGTGQPQLVVLNMQLADTLDQTAEATARLARLSMQLASFSMNEAEMLAYSDIGRDDYLKYRSPADTPILAPKSIVAQYEDLEAGDTGSVAAARTFLESLLPADVSQKLQQQLALPENLRSPTYVALDQALQDEAVMLDWIQRAAQPQTAGAAAISHSDLYTALPELALEGLVNDVNVMLGSMSTALYGMGANTTGYDNMIHLINETTEAINASS